MAGQDIEMNNFASATDAAYVYGELANGSQVKIKKADLVEIIRANMAVATPDKDGLMSKKFAFRMFTTSTNSNALIKLFKRTKYGFSGKITMYFCRSEENMIISEFNLYALSFKSIDNKSAVSVYRISGNHTNISFYYDEEYVYAYIVGSYNFLYLKEDLTIDDGLIFSPQYNADISNLSKITLM
ncbi:hypothetical protein [Bacteroides sp.]|uniref:hypothetical protein n=1 Tax=Bacteroides sp. TaxID=29523 RepID=UPI002612D4DD|nr:hypothetical protein [Bacteroides sp.]